MLLKLLVLVKLHDPSASIAMKSCDPENNSEQECAQHDGMLWFLSNSRLMLISSVQRSVNTGTHLRKQCIPSRNNPRRI
jgi:hypothetical protein